LSSPWKKAVFCSDLVFQFCATLGGFFFLGFWLGGKFGMWWLGIVALVVIAPLAFFRFMKSLESLEQSGE